MRTTSAPADTRPVGTPPPDTAWPALALARARHGRPRVPFLLAEGAARRPLGSVARDDLPALERFPDALVLEGPPEAPAVVLTLPDPASRTARLAEVHRALHAEGRIVAWRDEAFALRDREGVEHGRIERAASRFWGLRTDGTHGNGYVADASGRPSHLWIARRSWQKPTDPGRLDNLVGGGVPAGQSPEVALVREGWEEAGLQPADMAGRRRGSVLLIDADIPEGRQVEWLHVFDLPLTPAWRPRAVDGEVAEHLLLTVDEALARAAAGEMTTDAALATLDFALRHGVAGAGAAALGRALDALRAP